MIANRILISSNTISYIVDNIFISLHIEMLFDVANIRVIRWKHHLQCSILQLCLLPILMLSPLGEIAPNGEDKRQDRTTNERRTYFEVGSKRWTITFFRGKLFITSSLSCNAFEETSFSCLISLTASTKNLLRCSFLPSSTLIRSAKTTMASLNLDIFLFSSLWGGKKLIA